MKKSYYIAIVAIIAIVCLQAGYVLSLYNNYVDEKRLAIDEYLHIVIDKELHLRQLLRDGLKPQETRSLIIKRASEMTPQELDSLGFMEADSINLDAAKRRELQILGQKLLCNYPKTGFVKMVFL